MDLPARKNTAIKRRGYSDEEVVDMYELGRMWLEAGQHRKAEAIMSGLNEVAADFAPAWMGTALLRALSSNFDGSLQAAKQALRLEPENVEAMLLVATMSFSLGDVSTAGTYLGEVSDRVEQGKVTNPNSVRFFKMQMSRFQTRS